MFEAKQRYFEKWMVTEDFDSIITLQKCTRPLGHIVPFIIPAFLQSIHRFLQNLGYRKINPRLLSVNYLVFKFLQQHNIILYKTFILCFVGCFQKKENKYFPYPSKRLINATTIPSKSRAPIRKKRATFDPVSPKIRPVSYQRVEKFPKDTQSSDLTLYCYFQRSIRPVEHSIG